MLPNSSIKLLNKKKALIQASERRINRQWFDTLQIIYKFTPPRKSPNRPRASLLSQDTLPQIWEWAGRLDTKCGTLGLYHSNLQG